MRSKVAWSVTAVVALSAIAVLTFAIWGTYRLLKEMQNASELRVPLHLITIGDEYKPVVMTKINDKTGWMVLDTGAERSALYDQTTKKLTRPTGEHQIVRFGWYNLTLKCERRKVDILTLGERQFRNRTLPSADLAKIGLPPVLKRLPVWGILGGDFLSEWNYARIRYDQIILSKRRPTLAKGTLKFPLMILDHVPYLSVTNAEGQKQFWLIDTGTVFNCRRTPNAPTNGNSSAEALVASVKLQSSTGDALWLPALSMTEVQNGVFRTLSFISGMIGSGIIERYEVVLDYRNGWAYFVPYYRNNRRGTLGAVLYMAHNRLFAMLPFAPKDDRWVPVEVLSVDGSPVASDPVGAISKLRTLAPGQPVSVKVRTREGVVKEWKLEPFAMPEVGHIRYKAVIDSDTEEPIAKLSLDLYNPRSPSSARQRATRPSSSPNIHTQVQTKKDSLIEIIAPLSGGVTVKEIPLPNGGKRYEIQTD